MQQILIGLQGCYPGYYLILKPAHTCIIGMWLWVSKLGSTLR